MAKDVKTSIEVTADTKQATSALGDVETAAADAEKAVTGISDADVEVDSSDARGELGKIETASDDAIVALKAVGDTPVTADVTAARSEMDQLAADVKALTRQPAEFTVTADTSAAVDGMDDLRDSTDQTKSVVANFAGNAASELPGVADALGPANQAIGQFAEYAAEGNISIKNLAVAGAGLAAASFVMQKMADHAKRIAELDAFDQEKVDAFTEALKGGASELDAIVESLKSVEKIQFRPLEQFGDIAVDITPKLAELGIRVEDFAELVKASGDQSLGAAQDIDDWSKAMIAGGASADDVAQILMVAKDQAIQFDKAADAAEVTMSVFGETTDDATVAVDEFGRTAEERMADAQQAAADLVDEIDRIPKAIRDANDQNAVLDLQDGFDAIQTAAEEAWTAAAEGAGDAEAKSRDYQREINNQKIAVHEYMTEVLGLPDSQTTAILALIDQGKFDEAEAALLELTGDLDVKIVPRVDREAARRAFNEARTLSAGGTATTGPPTVGSTATMVAGVPTIGTLVVNMPRTADGQSVIAAVDKWARVDGRDTRGR